LTPRDPGLGERARKVRFESGWVRRLERFALGLEASALRREGGGGAARSGAGEEWVGYRPYRPGDDPRRLDWDLMARLEQSFVRVTRRETSEHWWVAVDVSASMGLGDPGKLQAAAERASALAALGLGRGARVDLVGYGGGRARRVQLGRRGDLGRALDFLASLETDGGERLAPELHRGEWRAAGRLFVLSDFFGEEPAQLSALRRGGRELYCQRVLARHELTPEVGLGVRWQCPESSEELELGLDAVRVQAYDRLVSAELERWRGAASAHGWRHAVATSEVPFESAVVDLLGRGAR
jgi:uncharacterized protein (DUF58 family)